MRERLQSQTAQTTMEYTMVIGFTATIAILITEWMVDVLLLTVSRLAVKIAIFLTALP